MANVTQVSWIDPDEVADLVRQLQGPAQAPQPGAWELHTLPASPLPATPSEPAYGLGPEEGMPVQPALPSDRVTPEAAPAADPFQEPVDMPEIDRIRQQLRALRQKAQNSGMIQPGGAPATPIEVVRDVAPAPLQQPMASEPVTAPPIQVQVPEPTEAQRLLRPFQVPVAGLGDRLKAVHAWATAETLSNEVLLVDEFGDVLEGSSPQAAMVVSSLMAWHSQQRVDPAVAMQEMPRIEHHLVNGRYMTILPVRSKYGAVSIAVLTQGRMPEMIMAQVRNALLAAIETEPGD